MKKALLYLIIACFVFTACEETEKEPDFMEINGVEYILNVGYINNMTWSDDLMGTFKISLGDNADNPTNFISFRLYSSSTSQLNEGTYTYVWWPDEPNVFTFPELITIDGHNITEKTHSWNGNIYVSKKNDNFLFEFDLIAKDDNNGEDTLIKGRFNVDLLEGAISVK